MLTIHGVSFSFNTTKVLYVAEQLGLTYEYKQLDTSKGEQKQPEHLARHPVGKLPTVTTDSGVLFESGAICRYLAAPNGKLYPDDLLARGKVDQWMDFFSVHLGRWLSAVLFERVFRAKFGLGDPKQDQVKEALGFIEVQAAAVNKHLQDGGYFVGGELTIADLFAFAYVETVEASDISLAPYPHLQSWYTKIKSSDAIQAAKARLHG